MNARTLASRKFLRHMLHAVLNEDTGELMEYRHLIGNPKYIEIWGQAYGNELGRLAQGTKVVSKAQTQFSLFQKKTYLRQDGNM